MEESGGDEERPVAVFLHERDRLARDHAVGLFFVAPVGGEPTERTADLAVRFGI
jgi:hypothetical protein